MRNKLFLIVLILGAFLAASCSSTFRICKDGKGYFLGSSSKDLNRWLCEAGDLARILSEARLSAEKKEDLYKYNCSPVQSVAKVKQVYAAMTPEERKSLRIAFKKNGYDINAMTC